MPECSLDCTSSFLPFSAGFATVQTAGIIK